MNGNEPTDDEGVPFSDAQPAPSGSKPPESLLCSWEVGTHTTEADVDVRSTVGYDGEQEAPVVEMRTSLPHGSVRVTLSEAEARGLLEELEEAIEAVRRLLDGDAYTDLDE